MLYQLGALTIDTAPFEAHEVSRKASADFAAKDVMGALRPQEAMGEGDDVVEFTGTLFPLHFGGLNELGILDQMRAAQDPQILVRGDGVNLGWRVITDISEKHEYLDQSGVGKQIGYTISAKRCPGPSAGGYIATLYRLLA